MIAYHGDQAYKDRFVGWLEWHKAQDKIVQGQYWDWEDGRGCAVGCSINSMAKIAGRQLMRNSHELYETYIGVPRILARLEDVIFEGLPVSASVDWPIRFAAAIRPGTDLSLVWPRFAVWLLVDPQDGVIKFAETDAQRKAIQNVADLYRRKIVGADVPISVWKAAWEDAAAYAAEDAADADAADAVASAASAAAASAEDADASAAYAAEDAADAAEDAEARRLARTKQADRLIALLEAA